MGPHGSEIRWLVHQPSLGWHCTRGGVILASNYFYYFILHRLPPKSWQSSIDINFRPTCQIEVPARLCRSSSRFQLFLYSLPFIPPLLRLLIILCCCYLYLILPCFVLMVEHKLLIARNHSVRHTIIILAQRWSHSINWCSFKAVIKL